MNLPVSSVRLKLSLWYTLVLGLIILVFSFSVYLFVKSRLFQQLDRQIDDDFSVVDADISEEAGDVPDFEAESSTIKFQIIKNDKLYYQSIPYLKSGLPALIAGMAGERRTVRASSGKRFRLLIGHTKNGLILTVAQDEEAVRNNLRRLLFFLSLALPSSLLLAVWAGYLMAGRLLKPVATMADQAENIGAENLSARLPVVNPGDEFGRLASVFNRTLGRLEDAFERQRRFTADASHELRTPLTAIQSVGEVALQEEHDADAYRDSIGSMLEETARLTHLVESLLLLTRAESDRLRVPRKEHDISGIVERAVEDLRIVAEEKGQKLETDLAAGVRGDVHEDTLRRALVNILDNAIKYTPRGGTVSVRLARTHNGVTIEVSDTGPGIPPEHQERVFDRFYRIDKNRPTEGGGAGLGLAIALWAVEANGGRIELESEEGHGSTFRIVLPM
jgi:heavy metal sensor kinase